MSKQTNILFITSDQHRGDCLGVAGHPCIRTPHLDKLSAMGMRFTRAYADSPVCIPARTTIITGIQAHVYGKPAYADEYRIKRDRSLFLGSLMTQAGYQTQLIGKTHWHTEPTFRAGFENVITYDHLVRDIQRRVGRPGTTFVGLGFNEMSPALNPLPPELTSTDWAVDHAMDFLDFRDQTQPFFLWLSLTDPHPPNAIHEPFYSMYDDDDIPEPNLPDWCESDDCPAALIRHRNLHNGPPMGAAELRKARAVYYGKITNLDHQIGRVIGKLHALDLLDSTLIVYTTDHGEHLGDFHDFAKSSFMESAANLPLIIVPPKSMGCAPGRVSDALIGHDDFLPTFCDVADAPCPDDVTGQSIMPIVQGKENALRPFIHGQIDNNHMLHDGKHKYLYFADDGSELLFDVDDQTPDARNLSSDSALLTKMRERLTAHMVEEGHEHIKDAELVNLGITLPSQEVMRSWNATGLRVVGDGSSPI